MSRQVVIGQLRVQKLTRRDGLRSWTIVWPEGMVHPEADRFLRRHYGSGTQRTYAYLLVDHLRWLDRECLGLDAVTLRDLERYMGAVGAEVRMPLGEPWRAGKQPYGRAALSTAAACLKGFYLHQSSLDLRECPRMTFAAQTLSAICPWTLALERRIARTATDTVRGTG